MEKEAAKFKELFGRDPEMVFHAPGRTELGGNHTDHEHGLVLAGPVDLYANAWVAVNGTNEIHVHSEGYVPFTIDLNDVEIREEEFGLGISLMRGVAAAFVNYGLKGFDVYMTSDIPQGSGLSSSAAVEILYGRICSAICGIEKDGEELAILGQKVENEYFGKPCGLLDQMACAADGIINIDFGEEGKPKTQYIHYDFKKAGYSLCIIDSGAGHENLTQNYADITIELSEICGMFGKRVLREVTEAEFYEGLPKLRDKCGDRAVLRAMHIYDENRRVEQQVEALKRDDIDTYLRLVKESGRSSWQLLQNVIPEGQTRHQEMAFALALCEKYLNGRGACRVHGGGFAGTIQAYVPLDIRDEFTANMEAVLGEGHCYHVSIGA